MNAIIIVGIIVLIILIVSCIGTGSIKYRVYKLKRDLEGKERSRFTYEYKNASNIFEQLTIIRHYEALVPEK